MINGRSNLKGAKELFAQLLAVKYYRVKDKTYVAYRVIEHKGPCYYDVIYVKHGGKPMHFVLI
ncbi:hypothetical protein HS7_12860 [Sulfolobales archaeon HS-7]|nr:hypothetical protein HS7_12860 [Sulfolobales archaeon HS-7]